MSPANIPVQRNIFLFGDLTLAFEQELRQLLHIRDNASLRDLFDRVNWAFRHEFSKLPTHEQEWLPRFSSLVDLLAGFESLEGAPAIRIALLCLYQLSRFIQ